MGVYWYYKMVAETGEQQLEGGRPMIRVKVPKGASHWSLITGRQIPIPLDRIIEVTEEELLPVLQNCGERVC
jgi:hypothetical protein